MLERLTRLARALNPAQLLILSFAGYIALASLLLLLPVSVEKRPINWVQAVFTITSATCVTGLSVVDTGTTFSGFGEWLILISIQFGGLGIMTMSSFLILLMGRRPSLHSQDAVSGLFPSLQRFTLPRLLGASVLITVFCEVVGAILLYLRWRPHLPSAGAAAYQAVFHAVSAFCNAGFSLFPNNLIDWASDPLTNGVVMALILLGGIGFFAIVDLVNSLYPSRRPWHRRFSLHTKLVLMMTALILVLGSALFYGLEINNPHTLEPLGFGQGLLRAVFHTVSARTAGFNTLPIENLTAPCLYLLIGVMFVGAGPGSCAGGVKVTTAGVLLMVVVSRLRGHEHTGIFGRSFSRGTIDQSLTLVALASAVIAGFIMLLLLVEDGGHPSALARGRFFLELSFETVSAFGTVGLSTGLTPNLSKTGMLLISAIMFIGRLGPLTLAFALQRRFTRAPFRYPEENVLIG